MSLKINYITNLQDARFCAAEEVEFVSFVLDRNQLYRISPQAIEEILPWLSGIQTVIDIGNDEMAWKEWQELSIKSNYVQIGLELRKKLIKEPKGLFFLKSDSDIIENEWFDLANYIEIPWHPGAPTDQKIFLHSNEWRNINPVPARLSTDLSLRMDIHSLDYDAFDELKMAQLVI